MGSSKWMSPASKRKGPNLRAPATTNSQAAKSEVVQVHWTPIFARGKLYIHVCDPTEASNSQLPFKLNDSEQLAKFVKNVLPGVLVGMQKSHGWSNVPRVVVHDKASYMVTSSVQRPQFQFADALRAAGFTSWLGNGAACTKWLSAKWSDVYLHETAISHIRRLLETEFRCEQLCESIAHFRARMKKVADHMNSDAFKAVGGRGLPGLARELHTRCDDVLRGGGERVPK